MIAFSVLHLQIHKFLQNNKIPQFCFNLRVSVQRERLCLNLSYCSILTRLFVVQLIIFFHKLGKSKIVGGGNFFSVWKRLVHIWRSGNCFKDLDMTSKSNTKITFEGKKSFLARRKWKVQQFALKTKEKVPKAMKIFKVLRCHDYH